MLEQPAHVALTIGSMTPSEETAPEQVVGVRELRDHLSHYLDEVADGATVVVTVRGRRVARLSPIEHDPFADLRARGLIREPTGPPVPVEELGKIPIKGSIMEFMHR
jgi:prevent-host-death family protein